MHTSRSFGGYMKVTNQTPFTVIAFGYHLHKGYAPDVEIPPGQFAEVNGPYLGEMGGEACYVAICGEVVCQEGPDDFKCSRYKIGRSNPIRLLDDFRGITIRHQDDPMEPEVQEWRKRQAAG